MKFQTWMFLGFVVLTLSLMAALMIWQPSVAQTAENALLDGNYAAARKHAEKSLGWVAMPYVHQKASRVLAEAYLLDKAVSRPDAIPRALPLLGSIPPGSDQYARRCLLLANYFFFESNDFLAGEQEAINGLSESRTDPELNLWMMRMLTGTERSFQCEPYFLNAMQSNDQEQRKQIFCAWVLSQFDQKTFSQSVDRSLGILGPKDSANDATRLNRLVFLKLKQAKCPTFHAGVAHWFLQRKQTGIAMEHLNDGCFAFQVAPEPYYLSVYLLALCQANKPHLAKEKLDDLAKLEDSYLLHRTSGMVHVALGELDQAKDAFEKSIAQWSGASDLELVEAFANLPNLEDPELAKKRLSILKNWKVYRRDEIIKAANSLHKPASLNLLTEVFTTLDRPVELAFLTELKQQ